MMVVTARTEMMPVIRRITVTEMTPMPKIMEEKAEKQAKMVVMPQIAAILQMRMLPMLSCLLIQPKEPPVRKASWLKAERMETVQPVKRKAQSLKLSVPVQCFVLLKPTVVSVLFVQRQKRQKIRQLI